MQIIGNESIYFVSAKWVEKWKTVYSQQIDVAHTLFSEICDNEYFIGSLVGYWGMRGREK